MIFRSMACVALALAASLGAWANPDAMGGYNAMEIERVGRLVGGLDGSFERMTGGVRIRLLSSDPDRPNLPIRADAMYFTWPAGADAPTRITMEGGVDIQHPQGAVTAERAEWDFDSGNLVFTGNPKLDSDRVKDMTGERIVLNFNTGSLEVHEMRAREVPLGGITEIQRAPALLAENEVRDWDGFVAAIRGEALADAPAPGGQIMRLLPAAFQNALRDADAATLAAQRGAILSALNEVLRAPNFHDAEAFAGVDLPEAARALLEAESLDADQQGRLNRHLLHAAYPDFVAPPRTP